MINIYASSRYPVERKLVRERVKRVLAERNVAGPVEVEISVVGDRKIRELNKKFRNLDSTTDVLSFPLEGASDPDGVLRLGDIVVSWPQARNYGVIANQLISSVIADLVEHGLLHLLGIHHAE